MLLSSPKCETGFLKFLRETYVASWEVHTREYILQYVTCVLYTSAREKEEENITKVCICLLFLYKYNTNVISHISPFFYILSAYIHIYRKIQK